MAVIDVVVFEMNGTQYALDISLVREIVEYMEITPVPRMPPHIAGILNLRGEITKIISLGKLLGLSEKEDREDRGKIMILTSEGEGSDKQGIIVDNVESVIQIDDDKIDRMENAIKKENYVKGIIKEKTDAETGEIKLIIWLDLIKIFEELDI